jgi:hypothetical protein
MKPANHVSRRSFLQAGALGVTGLAAGGPRVAWAQGKGEAKRGGTLVVRSGPIRGCPPRSPRSQAPRRSPGPRLKLTNYRFTQV